MSDPIKYLIWQFKHSISTAQHLELFTKDENNIWKYSYMPIFSVPFRELCVNIRKMTLEDVSHTQGHTQERNLLPVKIYLYGKKHGDGNSSSVINVFTKPHSDDESRTSYDLRINQEFLKRLRDLLNAPQVFACLKIKGINGHSGSLEDKQFTSYQVEPTPFSNCDELVKLNNKSEVIIPMNLSCLYEVDFASTGITKTYLDTHSYQSSNLEFSLTVGVQYVSSPNPSPGLVRDTVELDKNLISLVAMDGEVQCQRNVLLGASNSFFDLMLEQGSKNKIDMRKCSLRSLEHFVDYISGVQIIPEPNEAIKLLQLSIEYKVESLKTHLVTFLTSQLPNWFTVHALSNLYFAVKDVEGLEEVKNYALTAALTTPEDLSTSEYFTPRQEAQKVGKREIASGEGSFDKNGTSMKTPKGGKYHKHFFKRSLKNAKEIVRKPILRILLEQCLKLVSMLRKLGARILQPFYNRIKESEELSTEEIENLAGQDKIFSDEEFQKRVSFAAALIDWKKF